MTVLVKKTFAQPVLCAIISIFGLGGSVHGYLYFGHLLGELIQSAVDEAALKNVWKLQLQYS